MNIILLIGYLMFASTLLIWMGYEIEPSKSLTRMTIMGSSVGMAVMLPLFLGGIITGGFILLGSIPFAMFFGVCIAIIQSGNERVVDDFVDEKVIPFLEWILFIGLIGLVLCAIAAYIAAFLAPMGYVHPPMKVVVIATVIILAIGEISGVFGWVSEVWELVKPSLNGYEQPILGPIIALLLWMILTAISYPFIGLVKGALFGLGVVTYFSIAVLFGSFVEDKGSIVNLGFSLLHIGSLILAGVLTFGYTVNL